jgi:serine/threonine-protein kinase
MAPVYEAENLAIGRRVALKILEPSARMVDANARRFVREAKALARVRHPNVVAVLDIDADRITSALFIVQEMLVGEDLRSLLRRRGSLGVDETLSILRPIGEALGATHRASVVHGDVTPANIFLASAGGVTVPKLIDFGVARRIGTLARSRDGALLGTPRFMAPEHARGRRLDARADLWSFAAVFHRCIAGRTFEKHRPRLDELVDVSPELADVIERALAKRRSARYASLAEMMNALTSPPDSLRIAS